MRCPRTNIELTKLVVGEIEVFSSANGGVFFDNCQIFNFSDPSLKRAVSVSKPIKAFGEDLSKEQRLHFAEVANRADERRKKRVEEKTSLGAKT